MLKRKKLFSNKSTLFCFTPEVALATFIIEFFLAGYVLFRYGLNKFSRISIVLLLLLGTFQLAEYMMCSGGNPNLWSKIGTAAITLMPLLGFQLVTMFTSKSRWVSVGYLLGGLIIASIFLLPVPIASECTGKFVVLKFHDLFSILFDSYYTLFIALAVWRVITGWGKNNNQLLLWSVVIYASFLIPTAVVTIFMGITRQAVPSIMCGFAVFGAIILVFKIFPEYDQLTSTKKSKGKKRR